MGPELICTFAENDQVRIADHENASPFVSFLLRLYLKSHIETSLKRVHVLSMDCPQNFEGPFSSSKLSSLILAQR